MILTEKIEIKTTNKNIGYYKKIGFDINSGDVIEIIPEQLPETSKIKIDVKCDNCGKNLNISYYSYLRNTKDNKNYYCNKCSFIKAKDTNLKKYGFESPLQRVDIIEKIKNSNKIKYGVEFPSQSKEIKEKIKKTCLNKYGETSYMKTEQFKNSFKVKYGVDCPLKKEEFLNKFKKTNLEKYGFITPLKSEIIKDKISKTKKDKYGNENFNNRKKYKDTCLEIFGFENPMMNPEVQNKLKKVMLDKYDVEFPSQHEYFFKKMLKNGFKINKYKDLYYQGSYELDFLEKYYHIGIKRHNSIKYIYNNKEHIYFPDFYFEPLNLIIEIKSKKWYDENLEKNLAKQKSCQEQGYNFIFLIDKNYEVFNKLIKFHIYNKKHSWQYDIRLNTINEFKIEKKLNVSDFTFEYVPDNNKILCDEVKIFIEKYEWLGKMPNRPTHRFIAKYENKLAGVVIMATPNQFSKLLGDNTSQLEKLISRGACASWTPKNLASSLIMWSIKWMVKNTQFRIFTAYSDPDAKELGTIYQACNFIYLGQKYGSNKIYFDLNKPHLDWFSSRYFHRRSMYKKMAKKLNIEITWNKVSEIPLDTKKLLNLEIEKYEKSCINRIATPKHKYVYILGNCKRETKKMINEFEKRNSKLLNLEYPKNR